MHPSTLLTARQIDIVREAVHSDATYFSYGAGVDSVALAVVMRGAGIRPDLIGHALTGAESNATMAHKNAMQHVFEAWGWPRITDCRTIPRNSTGYTNLYENCFKNETMPSIAFGHKSCSLKWKGAALDRLLTGGGWTKAAPHPLWLRTQASGTRIKRIIGYDASVADCKRAAKFGTEDKHFDYIFPLQLLGMRRRDCVDLIVAALGWEMVPCKSSCFMCTALKQWELFFMAAVYPENLDDALVLEARAMNGRHSRFDPIKHGGSWNELVRHATTFEPICGETLGLGRSFAWAHWADRNAMLGSDGKVRRNASDKARFMARADALRGPDNALDGRHTGPIPARRTIWLTQDDPIHVPALFDI